MSLPVCYAIVSGLFFSVLGLAYKMAEVKQCRPPAFSLAFCVVAAGISLFTTLLQPTHWTDSRLWILGISIGVLWYWAIIGVVKANAVGSAAVTWVVLNLALLVPAAVAPLLFHEPLTLVDGAVLALFILMLLSFSRGTAHAGDVAGQHRWLFFAILCALFFGNGLIMILNKVKQQFFLDANSAALSTISYGTTSLFALFFHLINRKDRAAITPVEWCVGALGGVSSCSGVLLVLAAMSLPVVVTYTLSQGIALLGGVLLTVLIYREQFNPWKWAGVGLGLAVLLLAVYREPLTQHAGHWLGQLGVILP